MDKKSQLEKLRAKMQSDKSLPLQKQATNLVFGEGNPNAKIYFLGEAPGYWEDKSGRPFVGPAGKLLDQLVASIGLKRVDVYISNIVRFRPPENRDPSPEEIAAFAPYVDQEIDIIDPQVIVTLGRFSLNKFLPGSKISLVHGQPKTINWEGKTRILVPMYHPAAALRSKEMLEKLTTDFNILTKLLPVSTSDLQLPK